MPWDCSKIEALIKSKAVGTRGGHPMSWIRCLWVEIVSLLAILILLMIAVYRLGGWSRRAALLGGVVLFIVALVSAVRKLVRRTGFGAEIKDLSRPRPDTCIEFVFRFDAEWNLRSEKERGGLEKS
jgi:hypothetical protein